MYLLPTTPQPDAAHERMEVRMSTKQILAGALASVGLAAAGLGLATGTAAAGPSVPHQWCPGQSMYSPSGPGAVYVWDMNVCHTWQYVRMGMGNVVINFGWKAVVVLIYAGLYELTPLRVPTEAVWAWVALFFLLVRLQRRVRVAPRLASVPAEMGQEREGSRLTPV